MPLPLLAAAGISAIPAVTGLIGNLLGGKRRKREEEKASKGISGLTDIYKSQMGQDYFDSSEGLSTMRQIDENSSSNMDDINASANMNGLTDEARIAMMGQNMKAKQGAYSGMAGQASLWRQRNQQMYQGALGQLFSVGFANRQNQQNSMNNIVGGMQGGIDGAMNAGVFDKMLGGMGKSGAGMASPAAGMRINSGAGNNKLNFTNPNQPFFANR
jgi:hypothetical protein